MRRHAAIIGGGIGGLATAIALGNDGWRVTVHERDAALPATGTALGMWPAALRALDAVKAGHAVRATGCPQESGEVRRPDGSRIVTIRTPAGGPVHLISRPALLGILHRAASAAADLRFADPVDDPARLDADLIVAADGVFSRTRERLFGPAYRARHSGATAWRGTVDGMATSTFVEVWGRGVNFGVTPQEGGRTNWFAAAAAPAGSFHPGAETAVLRRMFGGWAAPVGPVLEAVTEPGILRHDVYVTPPLPSHVSGNAVLIGDAHAMTPDLGRGACEALVDAVTLAACLRETSTTAEGLRDYDRRRRPVTRRLARMAGAAGRLSRVRHALPVRDGLLRASMLAGPPA
ncbi:FAD-dependent monooxygenase [Actinoplanes philippinensis]|uniref:FAD-dependent monooxygenase n=1 Tax=Actinoplanes philippinensis TaxID=35752 RepID=UPI0033DE3D8C